MTTMPTNRPTASAAAPSASSWWMARTSTLRRMRPRTKAATTMAPATAQSRPVSPRARTAWSPVATARSSKPTRLTYPARRSGLACSPGYGWRPSGKRPPMRLSHVPLRLTTGAFMLNSGLGKRSLEGEAADRVHGMAANAIPAVKRVEPTQFGKLLANTEVALGAALLAPVVPAAVAGAGLTAFAAGLVQLYWK